MEIGSTPVVQARNLVYEVDAARLLDAVALSAGQGEFIGLVGPNGAGKSTLLRVISHLLPRKEGVVILDGRDLDTLSAQYRARLLALVPQSLPYTFGFNSLEVVTMGRYPHMGRFQVEGAEDRRIALEAMRLTETESFAGRRASTLSGGERQRVFISRALAQQPRLLLLDEPTSNLDVQHQLKVLELIQDLVRKGITAIAAVHDLTLAARYCHRLVLLSRGRVLAEGIPEEVLTPENIQTAFGVRAIVYRNALTGELSLDFPRSYAAAPQQSAPLSRRVHVVCGGGSGARLMYALQRAGLTVTAAPLSDGDTDGVAAETLGIPYVPIPSFAPIPDDAHERHLDMVRSCDVAVLCGMPIGVNNLRNLEALIMAPTLVSIETEDFTQRDHTGGAAAEVFSRLRPSVRCRTVEEAVEAVLREADAGRAREESLKPAPIGANRRGE